MHLTKFVNQAENLSDKKSRFLNQGKASARRED